MFEKLKEIIIKELGVSEDKVTMDARIVEDLEADSLGVMEIVMDLEDEFGLSVEDDDIQTLKTVGDIVEYLNSHVK